MDPGCTQFPAPRFHWSATELVYRPANAGSTARTGRPLHQHAAVYSAVSLLSFNPPSTNPHCLAVDRNTEGLLLQAAADPGEEKLASSPNRCSSCWLSVRCRSPTPLPLRVCLFVRKWRTKSQPAPQRTHGVPRLHPQRRCALLAHGANTQDVTTLPRPFISDSRNSRQQGRQQQQHQQRQQRRPQAYRIPEVNEVVPVPAPLYKRGQTEQSRQGDGIPSPRHALRRLQHPGVVQPMQQLPHIRPVLV